MNRSQTSVIVGLGASFAAMVAAAGGWTAHAPSPDSPDDVRICGEADGSQDEGSLSRTPTVRPIDQVMRVTYGGNDSSLKSAGNDKPCESQYDTTVKIEVSRTSDSKGAYVVHAGPLTGDSPRTGRIRIDRADWDLPGDAGMASASVQQGWAMIVRPRGTPPLRTIRTTTGRPYLTERESIEHSTMLQGEDRNRSGGEGSYAMLVAIEPGAGQYNGREFILLRDEGAFSTTMKFVTRTSDGSLKYATVSSGEYIVFDRATNEWTGAKPLPDLESLDDGKTGIPFLKEAICGAYKSSRMPFFKGDANRCR
ncbi:MAG: hypothetical protein NTV94_10430 [Planctomycetota bacterium]|nr:hypothetical protein [Planctomycetota bacterium]